MTNQELMSVIEKKYWTEGLIEGRKLEQERIVKLLIEETGHNGKTHYLGMHCSLCNLIEKIEENDDAV